MFVTIKKFINDTLTEPDGKTFCFVRVFAFIGGHYAIFAHAWSTFVQHVPFDFQAFSIGLGAMLATIGAALGMKKDSPKE